MAVSRKAMTEGIRTKHFDNPSVKNQRFLPAVHCGMTATGSHGNFDSLRGAPPFTQGSRGCSRTSALFDGSRKNMGIPYLQKTGTAFC